MRATEVLLSAGAGERGMDRHVLLAEKAAVLDQRGFLDVRMVTSGWVGPDERPQPVTELAGSAASFVLLAADGVGKSTVLQGLREREPGAVEVRLATLDKRGMRDALLDAAETGAPIYLDALDVAARLAPAMFLILEDCLTGPQLARAPLRLACRPAAWDSSLARALRALPLPFRELRLLPLTRDGAVSVVSEVCDDPDGFLDALVGAGLGRLAASPMRLLSAGRQWNLGNGLPESQLAAISFEVDRLLSETGRPSAAVPADRRRRLAQRLAAMAVFCRVGRFTTSPQAPPGSLNAAGLPSVPEPDEPGRPVTPAEYGEVLGTALFDAAGEATVGFGHQQYAEFLAAEYVARRRIIRPQLPALLGMNDEGLIPGPLTGAAAWLAALSPDLADADLLTVNAEALAVSAVEFPVRLRAHVVGGILGKAAAKDIDIPYGQDMTALAHPELAAQLAVRLDSGQAEAEELWWIARLAHAGQCRGVAARLLREALAPQHLPWVRCTIVIAVAALGDDAQVLRLRELADLGTAEDPRDEVLAVAIDCIYPRLPDTTALLAMVRPSRSASRGPYWVLLGKLSARIPEGDLPEALSWAAARAKDGEGAYNDLLPRLVTRGWQHWKSPDVREPLALLVTSLASGANWPRRTGQGGTPWDGTDPGSRRDLAVRVARHLPPESSYLLMHLALLLPGDLGWLTADLPSLARPEQDTLARCVSGLSSQPTAAEADLILAMTPGHPAYAHTTRLRDLVSLDSPEAQAWRKKHEDEAAYASQQPARQHEQHTQLIAALHAAAIDPGQWRHVADRLAAPDVGGNGDVFSWDLTARPGWLMLDAVQRQQALDQGLLYLSAHQLTPSVWTDQAQVGGQAIADWSGVYLLTTLASHDPGRLAALSPATWRAWAPAIIGAWASDSEEGHVARCRLIDLVPPAERQSLLHAALDHLDALHENGRPFQQYLLYVHLGPGLAPALAERLIAGRYHGTLAYALLTLLVEHAPEIALPACRRLLDTPDHDLAEAASRGLAELDPAALIDHLTAEDATPRHIADVAGHLKLSQLNDPHLAALARLLLRCVPFASDPAEETGILITENGYQARRVRRIAMGQLADHGNLWFFEELAAQHAGAASETIAWYRRRARAQAAELGYTGLTPAQLMHLLGKADARLVRNDTDLLEVILLQLDDLQRELTHRRHSRYLWNQIPDGDSLKDEDTISDWVAAELQRRLSSPGLLDREITISPRRGTGTRIDVRATTPTATHQPGTATVFAEAKLVTHEALKTALHDQLAQKYLIPAGRQHGIYLVYWADPAQRPYGPRDRNQLLEQLTQQARAEERFGLHIRPYLLDISHP
jgi:hypothetical protein